MNKTNLIILLTIALMLFAASASAEKYLYAKISETGQLSIKIIEPNLYNDLYFHNGITPQTSGFTIRFLDFGGNLIQEDTGYSGDRNNIYPFDDRLSRIMVLKDGTLLVDKSVSFCNNNGICEPCYGENCTLMENTYTCPDCPTGSADFACDLAKDGICDPDCGSHDEDCSGCTQNCWYNDSVMQYTSCAADMKGVICKPAQFCTGRFTYADDSGSLCCTAGRCINKTVVVSSNPGKTTPGTPTTPSTSGQPSEQTPGKNKTLWLIPVISVIALAILAYFLLRRPVVER